MNNDQKIILIQESIKDPYRNILFCVAVPKRPEIKFEKMTQIVLLCRLLPLILRWFYLSKLNMNFK